MKNFLLRGVASSFLTLAAVLAAAEAPKGAVISWMENSDPRIQGQGFDAGDADHDGDADLLMAREDIGNGVSYWRGDGGSTWTDATTGELPGWPSFANAWLEDFDHDDHADAFMLGAGTDGIHFSRYRPGLGWSKSIAISPSMRYSVLDFADVFSDPQLAVVASPPGAEGIDLFRYASGSWNRTVLDTGGLSVPWICAGDFQSDGFDDFIGADAAGKLFLYRHKGGTTWILEREGLPQDLGVKQVFAAQLTKDIVPDLIGIGTNNALFILANRPGKPWEKLLWEDSHEYLAVSVADCNGDALPDVLLTQADDLYILPGISDEKWDKPEAAIAATPGRKFTRAAFDSLDTDKQVDLIAVENGKEVRLFYSRDGSPPAGWAGFTPTGWITTTNPDCSVQVTDNTDLSTPTAVYQFSTNGGANWSTRLMAEATVAPDGRHATLTARGVPFTTSGDGYYIRFSIEDSAGNVGTSPDYRVRIDTEPPSNPTMMFTFRHRTAEWGDWSKVNRIRYSWPAGEDNLSGIAGYSVEITRESSTVPDEIVDFTSGARDQTSPELSDASNWTIHLRTIDRAGNVSVDTFRQGPFYIDTHAPDPPRITIGGASSWPDWYAEHQTFLIRRGDDGFADALGIRYLITRHPTSDPSSGIYVEDWGYSQSSEGMDFTEPWYIHAVTVDRAGNLSAATHSDPLRVDVFPPGGLIYPTPDNDEGTRVRVQLSRVNDRGSGLEHWDLLYREAGASDWIIYSTSTSDAPDQTVFFVPPDPNIEYQLSAQFFDNVGHASSILPPRSTRFEDNLLITTEVELVRIADPPYFDARSGVKVYHGDDFIGETDAAGRIVVPNVYIGDRITALYKVYTRDSDRRDREELGGSPWAYHIYLTNVTIGDDGAMSGHIVESMAGPMNLRLLRSNPLIGFHLVMSTNWNPDATYWNVMRSRMENASNYLYNVSDGQMFLELVELYENRSFWDDGADGRIRFRDFRANAAINGLYSRYSWNNMEFAALEGSKTYIHEMGHYAMGLYDEYITHRNEDAWYCDDSSCTEARHDPASPFVDHSPLSACVMDNQWRANNFCDDGTGNTHNTDTAQERWNHEPCWETIKEKFTDHLRPEHYQRWLITRPEQRSGHVPGPDALPCDDWDRVHIFDTPGGGGYGGTFTLLDVLGNPWAEVPVQLEHSDGSTIDMGDTNAAGRILIHNIYPPDRAVVLETVEDSDDPVLHYFDLPDDRDGPYTLTEGVPLPGSKNTQKLHQATSRLVNVDLMPGTTVTTLLINVLSSEELSEFPVATVRSEQVEGWIQTVPLISNGGFVYTAEVNLPDADEPSGSVIVATTDWEGGSMKVRADFHFVQFTDDTQDIHWGGSGTPIRLFGEAGAIPVGTIVGISQVAGAPVAGLKHLVGPYRIAPNDDSAFAGNMAIMLTYGIPTGEPYPKDASDLMLLKWNDALSQWDKLEHHHIPARGEVSAPIKEYGIYLLAGPEIQPQPRWKVF